MPGSTLSTKALPRDGRAPCRVGKKGITFYLEPSAVKQLRWIGLTEDKSLQALMTEAANMLFKTRGKAQIAK
jgi:hypothetical protein